MQNNFDSEVSRKFSQSISKIGGHYDPHSRKNYLECDICGNSFDNESAMMEHKFVHSLREKTVECEICIEVLGQKADLKTLIPIHSKERREQKFCIP